MRDVIMVSSRTDILVKRAIFNNTPVEKWFSPTIFVPTNYLKNLISTIWDSFFYGGLSPSNDLFFSVTDEQNVNPYTKK